ncbi:MAG: hypothetical protein OXG80_06220 [Chloroflexi bacterium]|nr:hypothetical protein [Chloroflexota bacterium]MCY3638677.1 hypothetical protein [Chloroflexota bacterium]
MADYILLIQMDIPAELEDDFNRLYESEHIPNLLQVDGVHSCTRYRLEASSDDGMARYAAIYEVDAPDIHQTDKWRQQADIECDWMMKIRPNTYNRTFTSFRKI